MGTRPNGALLRVLAAWALFSAGQWMLMIAVAVYAIHAAGTGGVGVVTVVRLLPAMFAAPVAGNLLDRHDRSRVVSLACATQLLAAIAAAVVVIADAGLIALIVPLAVISAASTPTRPALQSILPALARTPAELTKATAVWSGVDNAGFLAGAGLGGLLLAVTGPGNVVVLSAILIAVTVALVVSLPATRASAPADTLSTDDESEVERSDLLAGLRAVWHTPALHAPFAVFVGALVLEGATDVLLVALAIEKLGLGNGGPGLLCVVWGAGGVIGSAVLLVVVRRAGYGRAFVIGAVMFGVLLAVSGYGGVAVAITAMVPVGLGFALVEGSMMGVIPRLADDAVIGRVYGVCEVSYAGFGALGAVIAPALIDLVGVAGTLAVLGIGYVLIVVAFVPRLSRLDRGEQVAARVRDLLHGVPFLTPLPLPQLERLVRGARPVTVCAGEVAVRAGEVGEDFFVIDAGQVEVVESGRLCGPGSGFGEIALLRDVPRTATVQALGEVRLWAVDRSAFLTAVGAVDDVRSAADEVVAEHLSRSGPDLR
jgi:MFS family permease